MAELTIRFTGGDGAMLTRWNAATASAAGRTAAGPWPHRALIEAHTAAKYPELAAATREAGVPVLIDPITHLWQDRQWAGHRIGPDFIAFGNLVAGEKTIDGICNAWENNRTASFDVRLLLAIEGGRDAGGQLEGQTSAAIKTFGRKGTARLDLRCDHAAEPIAELRRLVDWYMPLVAYYEALVDDPTTMPRHIDWLKERGIEREFGKPPVRTI